MTLLWVALGIVAAVLLLAVYDDYRRPREHRRIMQLLREHGEMSGLELFRACPARLSRGSIYVRLHELEARGLVESREVPLSVGGSLKRRLYRLVEG